ncbi:MAG TPA: hypothetical protein VK766_12120 [Cytophagaceae bacterium]|jgi:hypothetical protein|nr:hypothetical protein [Cytophagaceae bacterium]
MKAKIIILFSFSILLLLSCKKHNEATVTPSTVNAVMNYLTNGSSKNWMLTRNAPLNPNHPSCNASCAMSQDNTFTFKSDSTFIFNHGSITVDSSDQGNNSCVDASNYSGIFRLINNNTQLVLRITYIIDTNTPDTSDPADTATIVQINDNQFTVYQKSGAVTDTSVFSKK